MRSYFVFAGSLAAVIAACGGKFTAVDSNKPTNQLEPSDSNQLCHDEYDFILSSFSENDLVNLTCADAFDQGGDCHASFDACVSKAKATAVWPPAQGPDCNAFAQALAQCNTTVGQYSDCIQQEVNVLESVESKVPFCSQGDEESAFLQAEGQVSAACLTIFQKCPLQFGGSSSSSTVDAGLPDGG
ncbi:MAG TPA: hypothetical protein VGH28_01765 [Polyangiaceae bacterium]|jgi:hypothetical protein